MPHARLHRRAFTLIEMIVVVVIVAVLVGLAAVGYLSVTGNAKDSATEARLHQVAKVVASAAATTGAGAVTYDPSDLTAFEQAAAQMPVLAAASPTAAGALTATTGRSTGPSVLSVAVADDGRSAALALKSPTGRCAVAYLAGAKATTALWPADRVCQGSTRLEMGEHAVGPPAPPAEPLSAPTDVTAASGVPESTDARLTWAAVAGATSYRVYLDGAASPALAVTGPSATLEALTAGAHTAIVTAVRGTEESDASPVASFTITYAWNDMIANALKITPPAAGQTLTFPVNATAATKETGEAPASTNSLWWKFTAKTDATYVFGHNVNYKTLNILTSPDVTQTGTVLPSGAGTAIFRAGTTYWLRYGVEANAYMDYTWTMKNGIENDLLSNATPITAPATGDTATFTVDASTAIGEPGEITTSTNSLWWKFTPAQDRTYVFANNRGYKDLNILTAADVGSAGQNLGDGGTAIFRAGTTYYLRWGVRSNAYPDYTWTMKPGPVNDLAASATAIDPPADGQTLSFDVASANAIPEPNEITTSTNSLWWKVTPTRDATYVFGNNKGYKDLNILTSPDVTATGQRFADGGTAILRGGTTYWLRWGVRSNAYLDYTWTMKAGAPNDLAGNATAIVHPAAGDTATFPVDASTAILEPGETTASTNSLWWKVTATRTGTLTFNNNVGYKVIQAYSSADPAGTAQSVAWNANFPVTAGTTYWFRVGVEWNAYMTYTLSVKATS